jgi:hypothetical protein
VTPRTYEIKTDIRQGVSRITVTIIDPVLSVGGMKKETKKFVEEFKLYLEADQYIPTPTSE